jgi:hypothetical protein
VFRHFTGIWFFTREPVGELSLYFFSCITLICFYFELNTGCLKNGAQSLEGLNYLKSRVQFRCDFFFL